MSFVESLTGSLGNMYFSTVGSVETRIDRIIEEKPTGKSKPELLAIPPVIRPYEGAEKMLHDIAYSPIKDTHPLRKITQAIFNYEGTVPPEVAEELTDNTTQLSGIIEQQVDGSLTSPMVIELFEREKMADELSKKSPSNPGEGYAGKALKVKRLY